LRGMRELLFRQFTLALGSYHWYAVIRANLSLLREFVGIQNAGNGSVNNSLHLYLWTQSARTALRVTSLSLVATIFASNRFVSPVLALLVIDCDRSLVAPKKEVIRKMTTLFGSFSTSEALFPQWDALKWYLLLHWWQSSPHFKPSTFVSSWKPLQCLDQFFPGTSLKSHKGQCLSTCLPLWVIVVLFVKAETSDLSSKYA
jgi:hypothetical protein